MLVNDGSGWTDRRLGAVAAGDPATGQTVISKVAGLPDGGAVAAGPGSCSSATRQRRRGGSRASRWPIPTTATSPPWQRSETAPRCVRWSRSTTIPRAIRAAQDNLLWQEMDNPPAVGRGRAAAAGRARSAAEPRASSFARPPAAGSTSSSPTTRTCSASAPRTAICRAGRTRSWRCWSTRGRPGLGGRRPDRRGSSCQLNGANGAARGRADRGDRALRRGASARRPAPMPRSPTPSGQVTFALGGGSGCAPGVLGQRRPEPRPRRLAAGGDRPGV